MADRPIVETAGVKLGLRARDQTDAVNQVGQTLLELGAVGAEYVAAMHERERSVSTFVGEQVAIPHGTNESRQYVHRTALAVLQFPAGVDWAGQEVVLCVGIAADGDEHVGVLSGLAKILTTGDKATALREATEAAAVIEILRAMEDKTP